MVTLSDENLERYSRQIMMPQIGKEGQKILKESRVFLAGLGGLGSISAYYLVAAGVGSLKVADRDVVQTTNLNRQILHWNSDLGRNKVDSAKDKLESLNPECSIDGFSGEVTEKNILELTEGCSLILDGTDNLETRYILNKGSIKNNIPFIFGGVDGFNGMTTTLVPGETPCLECLFPEKPLTTPIPGILGPVPGLVACIQSIEAIKLILNLEGQLRGRLLYIRTSDMSFRQIKVDRNPDCKACS